MSRYMRQTILPEVGADGQRALARAHVLVVGAGGLGVPVLQYLAGAGVGRITLIDPDTVAVSNLHRQPLYRMPDIGQAKAVAAQRHLRALNPDVQVTSVVGWLDPANVAGLLGGCTVAIDCADSFAASYILSDACMAAGVALISASALGLTGYAGGFCGGAPSLRAVFPDLPDRAATCATAGVLGPVVGMVGALQAQMALGVLLGLAPSAVGQIVTCDGRTWRMGGFRFDGAPEPDNPLRFVAQSQIGDGDLAIDLRDSAEAPQAATANARRLTQADVAALRPASDRRVVICCRSGLRAWRAARALQAHWAGDIAIAAIAPTPDDASHDSPADSPDGSPDGAG